MEGSGSSGFDMSKMSTAEKLLGGRQHLAPDRQLPPLAEFCTTSGRARAIWSVEHARRLRHVAGQRRHPRDPRGPARDRAHRRRCALDDGLGMANMNMGTMSAGQAQWFPRARRRGLRALEVHLRADELARLGGLRRPRAAGGDRLRAPGRRCSRAAASRWASPGGTMGGGRGRPPPSSPPPSGGMPPSAPPPSAPPPSAPPPSGGMPPSGSSDM